NRLVDGPSGDRLAVSLAVSRVCAVAHVPALVSAVTIRVPHTHVPPATSAYRAALKQRRAFSRRGGTCHLVAAAIGLEDSQILLKTLPADIARMRIEDTRQPIPALVQTLDFLLAIGHSSIAAPAVGIGARIAR